MLRNPGTHKVPESGSSGRGQPAPPVHKAPSPQWVLHALAAVWSVQEATSGLLCAVTSQHWKGQRGDTGGIDCGQLGGVTGLHPPCLGAQMEEVRLPWQVTRDHAASWHGCRCLCGSLAVAPRPCAGRPQPLCPWPQQEGSKGHTGRRLSLRALLSEAERTQAASFLISPQRPLKGQGWSLQRPLQSFAFLQGTRVLASSAPAKGAGYRVAGQGLAQAPGLGALLLPTVPGLGQHCPPCWGPRWCHLNEPTSYSTTSRSQYPAPSQSCSGQNHLSKMNSSKTHTTTDLGLITRVQTHLT